MKNFVFIYYVHLFIHYFKRALHILINDGLSRLFLKIRTKLKYYHGYHVWISKNELTRTMLEKQKSHHFAYEPRISIIVPTYETPIIYLIDMIESVKNQTYANLQLCIADGGSNSPALKDILTSYANTDDRIKIKFLSYNKGIAGNSNEALSLADGDFIALLDHDDTLAPFALFEIVNAINEHPDADFLYSDEDKISENGKTRFEPHFKPDWSPDTLHGYNYITHLTVIKRELVDRIGSFRDGYEGSQDYDIILRATEQALHIVHLPRILYHWRFHGLSAAGNPAAKPYAHDAGKKALTDYVRRSGIEGSVTDGLCPQVYNIRVALRDAHAISIVILDEGRPEDLERCVRSILTKSAYRKFEIIIIGRTRENRGTNWLSSEFMSGSIPLKRIEWREPLNCAAMNNYAAHQATGDMLLFLHSDIEVISPDWMEQMLEHAVKKEIGAVGAKLYYPDGTIQHAGVVIGIGGVAGHIHKHYDRDDFGYFSRLKAIQNFSAVTGACLMMRRDVFAEVGGFDESFAHSYNDVDLCLKVRQKGYRVVFTPYAELYHHESKSRGYMDTPEKKSNLDREAELFKSKWRDMLKKGDPYYNVNLALDREDFSIRID